MNTLILAARWKTFQPSRGSDQTARRFTFQHQIEQAVQGGLGRSACAGAS